MHVGKDVKYNSIEIQMFLLPIAQIKDIGSTMKSTFRILQMLYQLSGFPHPKNRTIYFRSLIHCSIHRT